MPLTEAQKRAQKAYYLKNKEKLAAYKAKYWQLNKHKWNRKKANEQPEFNEPESTETESTD